MKSHNMRQLSTTDRLAERADASRSLRPAGVLFFVPCLGGGGAERQIWRLACNLDRRAFLPEIAVARPGGAYERSLHGDVPLFPLVSRQARSSMANMLKAVRPLSRLVSQRRPCLLVSTLNHANIASAIAIRRSAAPQTAHIACIQNNLSAELADLPLPLRGAYRLLLPRVLRGADGIVAISEGVAEDLISRYPDLEGRIRVIYNAGVDPLVAGLAGEPLGKGEPQGPLLLACGRLERQKDYPTMLRAFALVKEKIKDAELWILGEGALESELKALAKKWSVGEKVHFLGFQQNPFKFMRRADLFLLSSRWEGFGNVLIEAMACRTPVIASDCEFGPREIIAFSGAGILFPPGDAEALASSILMLLNDPAKRMKMGEAAVERAQSFHVEGITARYASFFQEILMKKKIRSSVTAHSFSD